jgi:hypothetical protein
MMKRDRTLLCGRRERGSVLLLALLLLLVLSSIGLMVVQQITGESANVGAYRIAKQGYYVTEAGLAGPVMMAAKDQGTFLAGMQQSEFQVRPSDIHNNFFDFDTWGSFGPEFAKPDAAQFVAYFSEPVDTQRVPGFSTGGFCYRKYTVTSDGFLGTEGIDTDDPDTLQHTARARFVTHLFLGPFPCGF